MADWLTHPYPAAVNEYSFYPIAASQMLTQKSEEATDVKSRLAFTASKWGEHGGGSYVNITSWGRAQGMKQMTADDCRWVGEYLQFSLLFPPHLRPVERKFLQNLLLPIPGKLLGSADRFRSVNASLLFTSVEEALLEFPRVSSRLCPAHDFTLKLQNYNPKYADLINNLTLISWYTNLMHPFLT